MLKYFYSFIIVVCHTVVYAQYEDTSKKIAEYTIESDSNNEFRYLDKILKNKRIVILGECGHYDGSTFEAKVNMVKYMTDKLGFDILGLESCNFVEGMIYPLEWDNISSTTKQKFELKQFKINDLWSYLWTKTVECSPLIEAINNQSIKIFGIDFFGDFLSVESIKILLNNFNKGYLENINFKEFESFYNYTLLSHSIKLKKIDMDMESHMRFIETLNTIKNIAQKEYTLGANKKNAELLLQTIKNTEALYRDYFTNTDNEESLIQANNIRDQQMADNIIWYAEHNPKKKIIIWCANFHGAKNISQTINKNYPRMYARSKLMGEYLYEKFGDKLYSIGFTQYSWWNGDTASDNTIEYYMQKRGIKYGFIDFVPLRFKDEFFDKPFKACFTGEKIGKWLNVFDGIYFIRDQKQSVPISK